MGIEIVFEALAVLAVFVGLINEKKLIRWEDRMNSRPHC